MNILKILFDINPGLLNRIDNFGETPLINACKIQNLDLVKLLTTLKVDINKCDYFGDSPLIYALRGDDEEIISVLLQNKAVITMERVLEILEFKKINLYKLLLSQSSLDTRKENGWDLKKFEKINLELSKLILQIKK